MSATAVWGAPGPTIQPWTCGSWALELHGDELVRVIYDGSVVLRSIRAVVRDQDWNTVPVAVTAVAMVADGISIELRYSGYGAEFEGSLTASSDGGELQVALELTALRAFARNRIGLVALHPPSLAGVDLGLVHPDGSAESTRYPTAIAPHQPALDIAALAWAADGLAITMQFGGDVFEMEDQRNWTDASYKTYSTPLALPFPVEMAAGERVLQTITLRVSRTEVVETIEPRAHVRLVPAGRKLPRFGVGASTAPDPLPAHEPIGDFLLVELEVDQANWRLAFDRAIAEAAGSPLDVRIVASTPEQVAEVMAALRERSDVIRIGVFSRSTHVSEPELWEALLETAGAPDAVLVGGTRAHFTELNREHGRLPSDLPALTFSSTPQMHARGTDQLIESVQMQALTAHAAVGIAGCRPVHVGPVTLRPRFNAVATTPPPVEDSNLDEGYAAQHVADSTDPRQGSEALAAWLVAAASAFSIEGVASISFFETAGPRGLFDGSGQLTPAGRSFRDLAALSGLDAWEPIEELPERVFLVSAGDDSGLVCASLANLTPGELQLTLSAGSHVVDVALTPWSVLPLSVRPGQKDLNHPPSEPSGSS